MLFLVQGTISEYSIYGARSVTRDVYRLVEAATPEVAKTKFEATYTQNHGNGDSDVGIALEVSNVIE
jgi:hypothetical protein